MGQIRVFRHSMNEHNELLFFPVEVPDNVNISTVRGWLSTLSPGCEFRYTVLEVSRSMDFGMRFKSQEMEAVKLNTDDDVGPPDYVPE